jgi:hypothetical protein
MLRENGARPRAALLYSAHADDVSLEGTSLSKNLDEFVFISNPKFFGIKTAF